MEQMLIEAIKSYNVENSILMVLGLILVYLGFRAVTKKIKDPCHIHINSKISTLEEKIDSYRKELERNFSELKEDLKDHKKSNENIQYSMANFSTFSEELMREVLKIQELIQELNKDLLKGNIGDIERYKEIESVLKRVLDVLKIVSNSIGVFSPSRVDFNMAGIDDVE